MKLGMFMQPLHLAGAQYHQMYDMDVACAIHADKVGFDEPVGRRTYLAAHRADYQRAAVSVRL